MESGIEIVPEITLCDFYFCWDCPYFCRCFVISDDYYSLEEEQ